MPDPIPIRVDNRVRVPTSRLTPECAEELCASFNYPNPKWALLKRIGKPTWGEPHRLVTWAQEKGSITFPRGGLSRVRETLAIHGFTYAVSDDRARGDRNAAASIPDHKVALRDYQRAALAAIGAKEQCILRAPGGCGKTTITFALVSRVKTPSIVIVPNATLLEQWQKRAASELGMQPRDIGVIGGGKWTVRPLTIAIFHSLKSRGVSDELKAYFGAVIADEVQLMAADTAYSVIDAFPARYRIGVSDDHRRKDRKECLIHDVFGDVAHEVQRSELIKAGHVLDAEVLVIPTDFRADWYGLPPENADVASEGEPKSVDVARLLSEMAADEKRTAIVVRLAQEEAQRGQALVFSRSREHCRLLDQRIAATGVMTGFLIGGPDYAKEFQETVAGLTRGTVRVGVGTFQAAGFGLDLPSVAGVICAAPIAGNRQFFSQVRARVCRPHPGKKARLVYLWDRHVFGMHHLKNLVAWNNHVRVWDGSVWVDAHEYLRHCAA